MHYQELIHYFYNIWKLDRFKNFYNPKINQFNIKLDKLLVFSVSNGSLEHIIYLIYLIIISMHENVKTSWIVRRLTNGVHPRVKKV